VLGDPEQCTWTNSRQTVEVVREAPEKPASGTCATERSRTGKVRFAFSQYLELIERARVANGQHVGPGLCSQAARAETCHPFRIRAWQADIPCELATIDGKLDAEFAISKL